MNIQPDFKELLALLEKHQVEYMIVGGYAVAFHGYKFWNTRKHIRVINARLNLPTPEIVTPLELFSEKSKKKDSLLNSVIMYQQLEPAVIKIINSLDPENNNLLTENENWDIKFRPEQLEFS